MTTYAHGQGATAFYGGVFDGESIWLVPYTSSNLVKVNPATGAMTTYAHGQGATAFYGGVFDGESIWLVPYTSSNLVKVNPPKSGRGVITGNRNIAGTLVVGGNVGIGTTTPNTLLHLNSGAADSSYFRIEQPSATLGKAAGVKFTNSSQETFAGLDYTGTGHNNFEIYDITDTAMRMTIDTSGDVGIGTAAPGAKLHIWSSNAGAVTDHTSAVLILEQGSNPILQFQSANTQSAVGIVWGDPEDNDVGRIVYDHTTDKFSLWTAGVQNMVLDTNGNVGIGTTTPWRTLSVTGTVGFSSSLSATTTNANDVCIDVVTFEITRRTTDCSGASSLRYKQNVEKLSYGLADLMKLNPVSFQYTEAFAPTDRERKIGFIAEEVAPLIPEVVAYDDLGRPDSIDYPKITSLLVKAIQELNLKVSDLQASAAASSGTGTDSLFAWILDKFKTILGISFENGAVKANKICVGETCVTEEQFKAVFGASSASSVSNSSSSSSEASSSSAESSSSSSSDTSSSSSSEASSSSESSSETSSAGSSEPPSSSSSSESSVASSSSSSESSVAAESSSSSSSSETSSSTASSIDTTNNSG